MTLILFLIAVIIFACVLLNNVSSKIGMPMLLAFILLGVLFGSSDWIPINIENHAIVEKAATAALIFIMFYGGFGTSWRSARRVMVEAGLLATLGVVLTAGITGVICHYLLKWEWMESLLMGSVLASTDAASVFSILRSRKLGLKNDTAPLVEVESGSNDPMSYMLTAVMLSMMTGHATAGSVAWMLFAQIVFGASIGLIIAQLAVIGMKRIRFATPGFDSLYIVAVAVASYAIPSLVGGNGYLSAYIVGMVLGNADFKDKKELVHFFDGFTGLMQVMIFFMLGLLARPAVLGDVIVPALVIFAGMLLVSRPLAVGLILTPFRKYGFRQQALVSFVGLRGASSIVFAIMATAAATGTQHDLFDIVFCIVLISIALQGSLIPLAARKLNMIDDGNDVMRTFNDFSEETDMLFSDIHITDDSPWKDKLVRDLGIPKNMLLCLVVRKGGERVVPNGDTYILEGDTVVMSTMSYHGGSNLNIVERRLAPDDPMVGKKVREHPRRRKVQLMLVRRGKETFIPHGDTVLKADDVLYINQNATDNG